MFRDALVAPVPDNALSRHRWDVVVSDIPQLAANTRTQDQAIMHAVAALQQSNVQQVAAAQLERAEARAPKLPSAKFPTTVQSLKRVTGSLTEATLPTVWHDLANGAKSEIRLILVEAFKSRSQAGTAATPTPPEITKEILECFTQ